MNTTRLVIGGTVEALAATVLAFGGVLGELDASQQGQSEGRALGPAAAGAEVRVALDGQTRANTVTAGGPAQLGLAHLRRFRETADPAYLSRAGVMLRRARALAGDDVAVLTGLGSLSLTRHDFQGGLRLGRRALRLAPGDPTALGVVGDALFELGDYNGAFRVYDRLAAQEPGSPAYARIAHGRELLGRTKAATAAMRLAATSAGGTGELAAWTRVRLAELEVARGRLDAAERELRLSLAALPGYAAALDGLARVEARRGRTRAAVRLARQAVAGAPSVEFAQTLAELYQRVGNTAGVRKADARVHSLVELLRVHGVRVDLEIAIADADSGVRLGRAVRLARGVYDDGPSIEAADALAWTLVRAGRCREARRYSDEALRLGTRDASMWFRRGMIERCLDRPGAAKRAFRRALVLDEHFSATWGPVARAYAR